MMMNIYLSYSSRKLAGDNTFLSKMNFYHVKAASLPFKTRGLSCVLQTTNELNNSPKKCVCSILVRQTITLKWYLRKGDNGNLACNWVLPLLLPSMGVH